MNTARLKAEAKKTVRRPVARVNITWAGRGVDEASATASNNNRVSGTQQVINGIGFTRKWAFVETNPASTSKTILDGSFKVMPNIGLDGSNSQGFLVGWRGADISGSNGRFTFPQTLELRFPRITLQDIVLTGDVEMGEYPRVFTVTPYRGAEIAATPLSVENNTSVRYTGSFNEPLQNIDRLIIEILEWSVGYAFVKITLAYDNFAAEFDGNQITNLSILEETSGEVGTLPFGNVSANEIDLSLQNVDDRYFFGNSNSNYSGLAKSGRRVEPFVGFALYNSNGQPELDALGNQVKDYVPKGVYWTGDWSTPEQGTTASTTARDRLGLLQDVEYNGLGGFYTVDDVAKKTYWKNANLFSIISDILSDLRDVYPSMKDMEFSIDDNLKEYVIPLAFFERQSYFDIIKSVAQAGFAYAFMDTPTAAEIEAAVERGNTNCADILRIKSLVNYWVGGSVMDVETLEKREYTEKTPQFSRDNVANVVSIPYQEFMLSDDGEPKENGEPWVITRGVDSSIIEYGRREFSLPLNNLIQNITHAENIADGILNIFANAPITAEINTFGDVTRRIGDKLRIYDYKKNSVESVGFYAVTGIHTEYGDGLRQSISCRRLSDE